MDTDREAIVAVAAAAAEAEGSETVEVTVVDCSAGKAVMDTVAVIVVGPDAVTDRAGAGDTADDTDRLGVTLVVVEPNDEAVAVTVVAREAVVDAVGATAMDAVIVSDPVCVGDGETVNVTDRVPVAGTNEAVVVTTVAVGVGGPTDADVVVVTVFETAVVVGV